ncbi:hypothetical protein FZC33_33885 [Labrys sp. KNU-23]|uniref:hypothetical protein n=1 Tax=Labrys sp. KNU-23 TaxID=2789216 RepID=UPI0011EFB1AA|nr:hypothetical protein [Labrys sp. KNU-23]QEN90985.1 hypothetical protein FZC33_33885 [Labrys sp. KNU-23]
MKLSACTALLLLPLLGTSVLAEEFTLPDLTVEQPRHKKPGAASDKAHGLGNSTSQWAPDAKDKASKAFTTRPDICGGCELKLKARQVDRDDRLRRPFEVFE